MNQGDDTPTREAFHNAGQEIADRAEPQPTRPEGHPSERIPVTTDRADMVSQQQLANQMIKVHREQSAHAPAVTDKEQSPKEKEMEAFRLKMDEAFKKDAPSHEHTIKR